MNYCIQCYSSALQFIRKCNLCEQYIEYAQEVNYKNILEEKKGKESSEGWSSQQFTTDRGNLSHA